MSFLGKVTARNIFRFKSRLIMTVGGVAGCTALIVCGLAINDTVAALGAKQYQDVYQYDLMVVANDDDADAMRQKVASDGRVTSSMDVRVESGDLTGDSGSESIQLVAVPDSERSEFGKMVTLRPVRSSWVDGAADTVSLGDDGVIVSQSAASAMGVKAGGTVTLTNGDDTQAEAHVSAVIRSVIGSDVYVSETYYHQLFDTATSGTPSASSSSDSGESDQSKRRIRYLEWRIVKRPTTSVERHVCESQGFRRIPGRLCGKAGRRRCGHESRELRAHGGKLQIRSDGCGGRADRGARGRARARGVVHARQHQRVRT